MLTVNSHSTKYSGDHESFTNMIKHAGAGWQLFF